MPTIARKQTLVQLTEDLILRLDRRAEREGKSRSAVIREAVEALLEDEDERRYVEAYRRQPQTEEEVGWQDFDLTEHMRAIREEEGDDGW